jgi:hypothetical protein
MRYFKNSIWRLSCCFFSGGSVNQLVKDRLTGDSFRMQTKGILSQQIEPFLFFTLDLVSSFNGTELNLISLSGL